MLVLSRKQSQRIKLGDSIVITVVRVAGDKVRLGIDAPTEIPVHRQDVYEAIKPMKTVGIVREDPEKKIFEVASPIGVIAAIIPSTNPT